MNDGPHGFRSQKATAFPVGVSMAATWDRDLWFRIGKAMGEEFIGYNSEIQLGPCIDLCYDPRNGRSAETAGEDPYMAGRLGENIVKGIQSTPIMATIKHFVGSNRENNRKTMNILVTEDKLMTYFGWNFRRAIQEGGSYSIMSSYNLVNGAHSSENKLLLDTIARQRWGFPFYIMSDWNNISTSKNAIQATNDVCMGSAMYKNDLLNLLNSGAISIEDINKAVRNVLRAKITSGMMDNYPSGNFKDINSIAHQDIAYEAGKKAIILLKNADGILPLSKTSTQKIALIGPSAAIAQMDGGGSSVVNPPFFISPQQGIQTKIGTTRVSYLKGCPISDNDTTGYADARTLAKQSDIVIFVGGLDGSMEAEGKDRINGKVELPDQQVGLINAIAKVNPNVIVILESGGVCAVSDFISNIKGLLYAFYPGMMGGNALADVLFGDYNPGGKLPVTMPLNNVQLPIANDDWNDDYTCGYRYYDQSNLTPQFSFGFGLSYTTFTYSNLQISTTNVPLGQDVIVTVDVKNTGTISGDEISQLYLTNNAATVWVPKKELKGFERITLNAGETKTVTFSIACEDYYLFDLKTKKYVVQPGSYKVQVGGASNNLPLSTLFTVIDGTKKPDLKILNIYTIPKYPVPGDKIIFMATVKNYGTTASTADVNHRLSFNINGQDVAWSDNYFESIPVGGMAMISANTGNGGENYWIAPSTGTYSVTATIDLDNIIDENNESNNTLTTSIDVSELKVNLALKKTVISSSVEKVGTEANLAVDGSSITRWASSYNDNQWIMVDLGKNFNLNRVELVWEAAYDTEFSVVCSKDNINYRDLVALITNGAGGIYTFDTNFTDRYVKVLCTKRGTIYGSSLYELRVFGTEIPSGLNTEKKSEITIYPNPVTTKISINCGTLQIKQIVITDLQGRSLYQNDNIFSENQTIDVSKFVSGAYFISITSESNIKSTYKFVKYKKTNAINN